MKRKLFAVITAGLLLLSACGTGAPASQAAPAGSQTETSASLKADAGGEKVELEMLHFHTRETMQNSVEARTFLTLLDEFIAEHSEYTINESALQQADYHTKVMALAAADEMPDVFFTKGSWVQNFYDNNLMADMTEHVDQGLFRDGIFVPFTRDGKIYGMPIQFTLTSVVYYNEVLWKDIGYDAFPTEWDDLFVANEKFKEKGISTIALGNKDKWPFESCIISTLGDRFTGTDWTQSIILGDGKAKFTDPEFVATLEASQKMAELFNADFNAINNEQSDNLYATGKAASTVEGAWTVSYFLANADEDVLENTKMAVLPQVSGQKGDTNAASGGAGWSQSVSSKLEGASLQAAIDLNLYLTGVKYCEMIMEDSGLLGQCEVPVKDKASLPKISQVYLDFVQTLKLVPIYDIQMDGAVIDVMNSKIQELLGGTETPEAVAAAIQAEQDKLGS